MPHFHEKAISPLLRKVSYLIAIQYQIGIEIELERADKLKLNSQSCPHTCRCIESRDCRNGSVLIKKVCRRHAVQFNNY